LGQIENDVNERAVTGKRKLLFRLHHHRFYPKEFDTYK
ncbi:MAG: hypothetical protein K0R05_3361, partial [Anaerocolumna sp.]|nr:hypothetical protein [Anaerocolumna sp.]